MKKFIILLSIVLSSASYADKICYNLKEIMEDNSIGESTTCFISEINQCFFTSDEKWYTHTFQINCSKFQVIDNIAKNKKIKPVISEL